MLKRIWALLSRRYLENFCGMHPAATQSGRGRVQNGRGEARLGKNRRREKTCRLTGPCLLQEKRSALLAALRCIDACMSVYFLIKACLEERKNLLLCCEKNTQSLLFPWPVDPKTRKYQGRFGSGRPGGGAGLGRTGRRQIYFAQETRVPCTLQNIENKVRNVPPRARTSKILWKLIVEIQNQCLTSSFSSILSAGRQALFVLCCWQVDRRIVVPVNPFHARHVQEPVECKTQKYNKRVGSKRPMEQ